MGTLEGAAVVVTGASSGMGAGIAKAAAQAGAKLLLCGRDPVRLANAASEVGSHGQQVFTVVADLGADDGAQVVRKAILEHFEQIRGLVHSAGVFRPHAFAETPLEAFAEQWLINVRAPFALTQALLPLFAPQSSIVFITSIAGQVGFPGASSYCATKGAAELLSKALAVELAPQKIRVNSVAPGNVRTPMNAHLFESAEYTTEMLAATPAGRIGQVDDIAGVVVFLLSQEARYMYGSTVVVDGGWLAK
jgi:NAD(P)-dependent dehydrogenase (short-subunit alcohol dehydrogenase family)